MPRTDNIKAAKKPSQYGTKPNGKKATGAPEKYCDDWPARAEEACAIGATDEELAVILGISLPTLYKYEREYEDFFRAINRGKDHFDNRRIKASVRDRALGYNWQEVSREETEIEAEKVVQLADGSVATVRDDKGRKVMVRVPIVKTKTTNRHVPADPACAFFWLTNRNREQWQHVRVNRVEGKLDGPQPITNVYKIAPDDIADIPQGDLEKLADTLTKAADRGRASAEKHTDGDTRTPRGTA